MATPVRERVATDQDLPGAAHPVLARQPILDAAHRRIGYELLHRPGPDSSLDRTAEVLVAAITSNGLASVVGDAKAWVNCTPDTFRSGHHLALPPGRVVLEVLEDFDDVVELRGLCAAARASGYTLALDDYALGTEQDLLLDLVDIVKVDLTLPGAFGAISQIAGRGLPVLAEKVETIDERDRAAAAGATLFQGYFFARPELVRPNEPSASILSLFQLLTVLHEREPDVARVADVAASDAGLAARLLTTVNSSWVGSRTRFSSLHAAVAYLGLDQVRRLTTLSLLVDCGRSSPTEVLRLGMVRAELCRRGARHVPRETAHTCGLLSVLGSVCGRPLSADLLDPLGLPDDVSDALLHRVGELGDLLDRADQCIRGQWGSGLEEFHAAAVAHADDLFATTTGGQRPPR